MSSKQHEKRTMFRFLHCADIHLDSPLRGLEVHEDAPVAEIRGATRRAFDNLIELALEEEVAFLLIAGDLYDGDWKDYNTGLFFAERMGRLQRTGIPVFIVSGNHDAASRLSRSLPLPDNVTLFAPGQAGTIRLEELGVAIHGQSYGFRAETANLAAGFPLADPHYFNIGLLHTALNGREGHEPYAPCSLDDLTNKGYQYWALGHVHNREIVCREPWVVFPGNLQGRHIRESGAKGASLVTVEEGRVSGVSHHELDVLRWNRSQVDLSHCESPEAVYDALRTALEEEENQAGGRPLAVRLVLTGSSPVHEHLLDRLDMWTGEIRGIAAALEDVWLEKVLIRTRPKEELGERIGRTPLAGLLRSLEELHFEGEEVFELVPELAALRSKLPAELSRGGPFLFDGDAEQAAALREEVKEMLIAKLLRHGGRR